jgi:hypothetical protein
LIASLLLELPTQNMEALVTVDDRKGSRAIRKLALSSRWANGLVKY